MNFNIGDRVVVNTPEPFYNLHHPPATVDVSMFASLGDEYIVTMLWADGDVQCRTLDDTADAVFAPSCLTLIDPVELAEPLAAPLERCDNFADMWITGKFNDIMGHEDNAELARALVVGLAINDPERPAASAPVGEDDEDDGDTRWAPPLDTKEKADNDDARDILFNRDADGDFVKMAYNRERGVILFQSSPGGAYIRVADIPMLIVWLKSRETKHRGEAAS